MTNSTGPAESLDDEFPPLRYFGRRWNAPAFENAVRADTPVGAVCLFCDDLIDDGDDGFFQPALLDDGPTIAPIHIECHLRSVLGCVAHLEHRCSCYGGGDHDGTTRNDARAVLNWLIAQQTAQGVADPGFVD